MIPLCLDGADRVRFLRIQKKKRSQPPLEIMEAPQIRYGRMMESTVGEMRTGWTAIRSGQYRRTGGHKQ